VVVLVVLLIVTNLFTAGALAYFALRPAAHPTPDAPLARTLDRLPPTASSSASRRVISIEILNPIEVAATRGRLAGIAGSIAPGLIRRIVYDQTIKTMRRHLADEQVVADLRLHTLRAPERPNSRPPSTDREFDVEAVGDGPSDVRDGRPRGSGVDRGSGPRPGA
jgi:hypothetical protein